jgi:pSer/pThr/pTyr-binding forkhead associated (FHA) protein
MRSNTGRVKHDSDPESVSSSPAGLEVVAGPLEGRTFSLAEGELSIGREPCNQISLLDSLVSRRHCVIRWNGDGFLIEDLDSRNSTFVNNVPVKHRLLADGDQIRVGKSILVFRGLPKGPSGDKTFLHLDYAPTPSGTTEVLRKQDAIYLRPAQSEVSGATHRTVRDLNVLFNFSKSLNSVRGLAAIQHKVLESVLEISSADHACILLTEDRTEGFTSVIGWDREPSHQGKSCCSLQ